jgi:glycine betaine/proline transport system substrate-binding protein
VVQSSEAGMLSQVDRAQKRGEAMVFLGWEPHPMNTRFKMKYLTGGDDSSAPTSARPPSDQHPQRLHAGMQQRWPAEEPVVHPRHGKHLMGNVLDDKMKPDAAAKAWLKKNPQARHLARRRDHR